MVESANSHQYESAVTTMPRKQLEEFALIAARTMETLEQENLQLKQDLDDSQKIDIEVINGWRTWTQMVDEEREKWAAIATRLSEENQGLSEEYKQAVDVIEKILDILGTFQEQAAEDSEDGSNAKSMRRTLKKIAKKSKETIAKYAVVEGEDPELEPEDNKENENLNEEENETHDEQS